MKRRVKKYSLKKECRRYRQHQKLRRNGILYCKKTRYIFIPHTYTPEPYFEIEKAINILIKEFHYAIQITIE